MKVVTGNDGMLEGRGSVISDTSCARFIYAPSLRRSNAVRGTLWRETGRFTFARIWSVMRHCQAEVTVEEA